MAEERLDIDYAEGRSVYFDKPKMWATGKEIREAKEDIAAAQAVNFFRRYDEMGLPFGPWGLSPNPQVEIVEALAPLRDIYRPRML